MKGRAQSRVLLDATSVPESHGGVARFISGLLEGLEQLGRQIDVVAKREDIPLLASAAPSHHYIVAPAAVARRPFRLVWEQLGLPGLARRRGATVIHSPHYTFPIAGGASHSVTLHDATFFSDRSVHSRLKGAFFRSWIRLARRRATALVAVSAATASEIERFVPHGRVPISVAHLGVDESVFSPPTDDAVASVRAILGLRDDEPYLAFLGTIEPRKNVAALLQAQAALVARDPSSPTLVLSGARGWDSTANSMLDALAAEQSEGGRRTVIEAGYLPLELLSAFLGGALLVVYPSLGEGFGLPVLEAMSCGTAVLTTPRLSIPEVGGDAVAYSETDPAAIEEAIRSLLLDEQTRAHMAQAGLARSRQFTWAACAQRYVDVWDAA